MALIMLVGACSSSPEAESPEEEFSGLKSVVMEHEEAIEACMRERGFDYVAFLPNDVLLEEAAFRAEQTGGDIDAAIDAVEVPEDPNAATRSQLSEEELAAWEAAYWGDESAGDPGCYQSTYEAAGGTNPPVPDEEMDPRIARIKSDPRVVAAEAGYITCMKDAGYDVSDQFEIHRLIDENTDPAETEVNGPSDYEIAADAAHGECQRAHDAVYDQVYAEEFGLVDAETPSE